MVARAMGVLFSVGGLVRHDLGAGHLCGLLPPFGRSRIRAVGLGTGYSSSGGKAVQDGVHGGSPEDMDGA